mgnify:CR=1 FL=1
MKRVRAETRHLKVKCKWNKNDPEMKTKLTGNGNNSKSEIMNHVSKMKTNEIAESVQNDSKKWLVVPLLTTKNWISNMFEVPESFYC